MLELLKFFYRLFVPSWDHAWYKARSEAKEEVKWQPFLFAAAFIGAALTLLIRNDSTVPPGGSFNVFDFMWLIAAFICPVSAAVSAWAINSFTGRKRYFAMWGRLASNIGLLTSILSYQVERILSGFGHPFEDSILFASVVFLVVIILGDIKFLTLTERLADELLRRNHADK